MGYFDFLPTIISTIRDYNKYYNNIKQNSDILYIFWIVQRKR